MAGRRGPILAEGLDVTICDLQLVPSTHPSSPWVCAWRCRSGDGAARLAFRALRATEPLVETLFKRAVELQHARIEKGKYLREDRPGDPLHRIEPNEPSGVCAISFAMALRSDKPVSEPAVTRPVAALRRVRRWIVLSMFYRLFERK
jgi:hypothetical protein